MWKSKFRSTLNRSFAEMKKRNPRYSTRAFARDLGLSSGALSEYMSGKRSPLRAKAIELIEAMELKSAEKSPLLRLLRGEKAVSSELPPQAQKIFSTWYYLAIRNLYLADNPPKRIAEIANRLSLPQPTVKAAVLDMLKLGVLVKKQGRIVHSGESISSSDDVPSEVARKGQRSAVVHSLRRMRELPVHERDLTSYIFVGSREAMAEAKREIRSFYARLSDLMTSSSNEDVFCLSVQLCPLTNPSGLRQKEEKLSPPPVSPS